MRHKSIYLLCALLVVGSFYVAKHANQDAVHTAQVKATAAVKQVQQNVATNQKLQGQLNVANSEVQTLQKQCQLGVTNYQLMTSTERLHATLPVCALQNASASIQ